MTHIVHRNYAKSHMKGNEMGYVLWDYLYCRLFLCVCRVCVIRSASVPNKRVYQPWPREIGILPERAGILWLSERGETNRVESRWNRSTRAKHWKQLSNPRNRSYGMCYLARATRGRASNSFERPNRESRALAYLRSFWCPWKRFAPIWNNDTRSNVRIIGSEFDARN